MRYRYASQGATTRITHNTQFMTMLRCVFSDAQIVNTEYSLLHRRMLVLHKILQFAENERKRITFKK